MTKGHLIEAVDAAKSPLAITVNGATRSFERFEGRSLLALLREDLRLTGAKPGCGEGRLRRLCRAARR